MNPDGPQSNEDFMEGLPTPTGIIPAGESETMTNHAKPFWKRLDYGKIFLGFPKQRWILLVGDLLLIALAHYVSLWIRFGFPIDPAAWAIAFAVTLLCYPPALYIFDLYNISRLFSWYEIAYRSALAVIGAETISAIVLYLLPVADQNQQHQAHAQHILRQRLGAVGECFGFLDLAVAYLHVDNPRV